MVSRLRHAGRRELVEFRRWLEDTRNFLHLSLLVFVPLLIGFVTLIANTLDLLPFLLFPPLASGTHTLFSHPESKYASPRRFVGGMTAGAVCGWVALEVTARYWYQVRPSVFHAHPGAAAFGVFLTGVVTWLLDLEESQAFSTALLVLVVGVTQLVYVASVFLSSTLVAGVFALWRREVYEQRADYLYQTTHGDDAVLVRASGETGGTLVSFGAQLAAAHEAGKVVLFETVGVEDRPTGETVVAAEGETDAARTPTVDTDGLPAAAREAVAETRRYAEEVSDRFDVPCEIVVVAGESDDAQTVLGTAREMNCDLIVTPYEADDGKLSRFVRELFTSTLDVVVVRTDGERDTWRRILVPIKHPGDVAHAMLDFADRLAGDAGKAAVCHCIESEGQRRDAEEMLANLAETFERAFETRVADVPIEDFLAANDGHYDLCIVGSSTERTMVSRFIDPPTFQRLDDLNSDVAIVHHG
ncbi:MAG: HPP family protein [Haloplanus sp.]